MSQSYVAYGVYIRSTLRLPELVRARGTADVEVRLRQNSTFSREERRVSHFASARGARVDFFEPGVGAFVVRDGCEIVINPIKTATERLIRASLLGPALAVLLHQRGFLVLHASAVTLNGGAAIFLGAPGWGKSTMAAALHARGYPIVADDVTAVRIDRSGGLVFPGFPRLKLWPSALEVLQKSVRGLPRVHPNFEKRASAVRNGFSVQPVPLRRVYVLASGSESAIEPIGSQDGLVELIRHSYCTDLLKLTGPSEHFVQCTALATDVQLKRLIRPRDLSLLPDLVNLIESDV